MLLKLGGVMMTVALAVAAGVVLVVVLRAPIEPAAANSGSAVETTAATPQNDLDSFETFDQSNPEPGPAPEPRPAPEPEPAPRLESEPGPEPEPEPRQDALVGEEESFPAPDEAELVRLEEPRRFAPDPGARLTLTLPSLGIRNAPVYDSDSPRALAAGVGHVPETSMPWDGGAQRNTYLAAHRLGYPGSGSRLLFYNLDQLGPGDEVILKGRGETYRYRVTETMVVDPNDRWVMGQVVGRDMVTLQTCTPIPTFERRLIVRADRI